MAKIKIIDDDVDIAEDTAAILQSAGHDVSLLHTTEDAVQVLVDDQPDILILDVMFPDNPVAGFDLARQIRRNRALRALPIIMLTGVNREFPMDFSGKDIDSDWMPVQEFLEKPVDPSILLDRIQKMLD
jgi:DNA-binding response OmpR family regulator